jgi:hypothetical protein
MTDEDEAFEDLAKRQGDWGLQGSRKHQIIRFAENNARNEEMTQEIIQMARDSGMELYGLGKDRARFVHHLEVFAKLVAAKEKEACAQLVNDDRGLSDDDAIRLCRAIRARGNIK